MGLLSSSKSSSTTNIFDRRIGATDRAVVAAEGSTVIQTDLGAVAIGGELTSRALFSSERTTEKAIRSMERTIGRSLESTEKNLSRSLDSVDRTIDNSYRFADNSLDFAGKSQNASLEVVTQNNKTLSDIASLSIDKIEASTRNESIELLNGLIQVGAVVVAIYIIAQTMR